MRIYRCDETTGHIITQFGSTNVVISGIAWTDRPLQISRMRLGPGGVVGHHQAVGPQLFLVVEGEGWVRGEGPERRAIRAGQAAFWENGEWHESGSEQGMVAMVIEGEALDPGRFLREEALSD
ncbi:MAG TPA: cupin domain-containing protein [Ktedonobacterales bacterium]|nr:cupin domain-containing protein [Ktedonobacterales bacterium]